MSAWSHLSYTRSYYPPLWEVVFFNTFNVVVPVLLVVWAFSVLRRRRLHRRRERMGLCPRCGYDVRDSKARCPECGDMIYR